MFKPTLMRLTFLLLATILIAGTSKSQQLTNRGKEFWVGYGHFQDMNSGNSQDMVLYLSTESDSALVTVTIDSAGPAIQPWTRVYKMAPFSSISTATDPATSFSPASIGATGPFPKTGTYDCRLTSSKIFTRKGIHIQSSVPILAYAHIYSSANSGATVLIPVEAWGYEYLSVNSKQEYANNCYSWLNVIAQEDNTLIEIIPTVPYLDGNTVVTSLTPFTLTLQKGQIYQMLGAIQTGSKGYELTGTRITSLLKKKIAVISGSSRTSNPCSTGTGGGDNDIQQLFPLQAWGKRYLTAPLCNSTALSSFATNIYKIMVADPTTVVVKNGVVLTGLVNNTYYTYESTTADYITADKPVMVGQFISGGGCLNGGSLGDPEMIYISPIEQQIKTTSFYKTTASYIQSQYAIFIVPTSGMPSLKIDGINFTSFASTNTHSYAHPNRNGYTVAAVKWPLAAQMTSRVECDSAFSGVTFGYGSVESYGYNIGAYVDSIAPAGFRLSQVMPVNIHQFKVIRSGKDALLDWTVSNEQSFDRYEVQRSVNRRDFDFLHTVKAINAPSYHYTDMDVATKTDGPKVYYRLKSVNKDGSFVLSDIVALELHPAESIVVYPNPFTTSVQLRIEATSQEQATLSIHTITGTKIADKKVLLSKGMNNIEWKGFASLPKGLYILSLQEGGRQIKQKILKD